MKKIDLPDCRQGREDKIIDYKIRVNIYNFKSIEIAKSNM